jgi:hypothetical protein
VAADVIGAQGVDRDQQHVGRPRPKRLDSVAPRQQKRQDEQ